MQPAASGEGEKASFPAFFCIPRVCRFPAFEERLTGEIYRGLDRNSGRFTIRQGSDRTQIAAVGTLHASGGFFDLAAAGRFCGI